MAAIREVLQTLYCDGHRRIAYMQHAALGERTRVNADSAFLGRPVFLSMRRSWSTARSRDGRRMKLCSNS